MIRTVLSSVAILSVTTSQLVAKELHLGYETFCLPSHYNTLDLTKGSLFTLIGLDDEPHRGSFQFFIPAEEVKLDIPSYHIENGKFVSNLKINIRLTNSNGQNLETNSNYRADALRLVNKYSEAHIEYDKNLDIYRVSDFGFPPPFIIWDVLTLEPLLSRKIPEKLEDYYLGLCSSSSAVLKSPMGTTCDYFFEYNDYLINIGTSEENLLLQDKLTPFVKRRLEELKHEC